MKTFLGSLTAISIAFSSLALADTLNTQDLIKNRISTAARVQQIEKTIEAMKDQIDQLKEEKEKLDQPIELKAEQFLSILSQHSEVIGKCQIKVSNVGEQVTLQVQRADGLGITSSYDLKKLKKGRYQAIGRLNSDKRLIIMQAQDMYDNVNDKETKITMVLDDNNQVKNLRVAIALKGKNFDTKDCK